MGACPQKIRIHLSSPSFFTAQLEPKLVLPRCLDIRICSLAQPALSKLNIIKIILKGPKQVLSRRPTRLKQ